MTTPEDPNSVASLSNDINAMVAAVQSTALGDKYMVGEGAQESVPPVPVVGPRVGKWIERETTNYDTYATPIQDLEGPKGVPSGEWGASGARYEWKEEYGDVAPADEGLERMLFGEPGVNDHASAGLQFDKYGFLKPSSYFRDFRDAPLHPVMMGNIQLAGYQIPTPIQRYCIPAILDGHDLLSCAQTGSGKTAAFLIPILSKLMGKANSLAAPRPVPGSGDSYIAQPLVLVVAPTRELATQIFDESRRFCYRSKLRPCVVYGGADSATQRSELKKGCDVLIGTPGRLADFVERGRILSLRRLKFIVIDEADEMLDMGFEPQIRKLLQSSGNANEDDDQQVLMFSATFQKSIRKLARDFLSDDFIQIKVGRIGSTHENITQRVLWVDELRKKEAIYDLLCTAPPARTLIFVNHKRVADSLDDFLYNLKLPTTSIHGDRTQREREDAILAFRSGKCPIMIATGIAARGLDIKNVMHVINYDLVQNIDEYIHRIGRTARIGNRGLATTFFNSSNEDIASDLVKVLLESGQEVPEFLEPYRPIGEVTFEEPDSDAEDEDKGGDANGGTDANGSGDWGNEGTATNGAGDDSGW
ncbi:DEAD-domain-containing protein [Choiromyces venosus 120613-1]|uniref:RNA helicase n=1 Tax=Choiromyces venosus 120613-1 TaxID=1336337 RepID=A0A3N4JS69_9PEZI|nr:DEAD-domain-containing protein [Choiromyces venosus 120613-1]